MNINKDDDLLVIVKKEGIYYGSWRSKKCGF